MIPVELWIAIAVLAMLVIAGAVLWSRFAENDGEDDSDRDSS